MNLSDEAPSAPESPNMRKLRLKRSAASSPQLDKLPFVDKDQLNQVILIFIIKLIIVFI